MKTLPPGENVYLLRGAGQVDRLLGMGGERPQLLIRT
jgi:hypothetical protein